MEKRKATCTANLEHVRDLGAITEAEFKSHEQVVLGMEFEEATS